MPPSPDSIVISRAGTRPGISHSRGGGSFLARDRALTIFSVGSGGSSVGEKPNLAWKSAGRSSSTRGTNFTPPSLVAQKSVAGAGRSSRAGEDRRRPMRP